MRAYQCSQCKHLTDLDEYCRCFLVFDIRPPYREKGDAKICKDNFEFLAKKDRWHKPFYWEQREW